MNSHPASEIPDDERDIPPCTTDASVQPSRMNGLETLERLLEGDKMDSALRVECEHSIVAKLIRMILEMRGYTVVVADKEPLVINARGKQRTEPGAFVPTV